MHLLYCVYPSRARALCLSLFQSPVVYVHSHKYTEMQRVAAVRCAEKYNIYWKAQ